MLSLLFAAHFWIATAGGHYQAYHTEPRFSTRDACMAYISDASEGQRVVMALCQPVSRSEP
jgi:hypothetical protein